MPIADQPAALRLTLRNLLDDLADPGNSLSQLSTVDLQSGVVAAVLDNARGGDPFFYYLDKESAAVVAPPGVIAAKGGGRWIAVVGSGGGAVNQVTGTNGVVAAPTTGNVVVSGAALYARDGSNGPMTGPVNMGGQTVSNAASYNGVALTTGGSATNFLNEQGNYVAVSGGGAGQPDVTTQQDIIPTLSVPAAGIQDTGVNIAFTPAGNGAATGRGLVVVTVNGVTIPVGDGVLGACYFGPDFATIRPRDEVVAGDSLFWVEAIAGYPLDVSDRISLDYQAA